MYVQKKRSQGTGCRVVASLIVFMMMMLCVLPGIAPVQASADPLVRVGLYFGQGSVSTVSLRSETGFNLLAIPSGGGNVPLWDHSANTVLIVRKDTWYVRSPQGGVQDYNPADGMPFDGIATGPHHLQIGEKHADFAAASAMATLVRNSGVKAYPVYEGGWYVWSGAFVDATAANAGKQAAANLLGSSAIAVIPANNARYEVLDTNLETLFMYGGSDGSMTAVPKGNGLLSINGKRYRGNIEFRRFVDSDMTVVNVLSLEPYLYGVVPSEIEATAPVEAVKAQAVAARTYALKNLGRYSRWDFDLTNTVATQVYHGYDAEKIQSNQAVDATKGQVARYNGELASLFYFSSSGGMTEDNSNVWGTPLPYLKSVPDPYETGNSFNYSWQRVLSVADVERYLTAAGIDLGRVQEVTILAYSDARRVTRLRVSGTNGSMTFQREACRTIFELPSQRYALGGSASVSVMGANNQTTTLNPGGKTVLSANGTSTMQTGVSAVAMGANGATSYTGTASGLFVFTGSGWGHAVGMSQEGAKGFARNGYNHIDILTHYFPGVIIN